MFLLIQCYQHTFMNYPRLFFLLQIIAFNTYSQCSFKTYIEKINPSCGKENGIIQVMTNAINPSFRLGNNIAKKDSIFTDLKAGSYTLTVEDQNGCINYYYTSLTSQPIPTKDLSIQYKILDEKRVVLTNSGDAIEKEWSFGDNRIDYGGEVIHTYGISGTFKVTLKSLYDCFGIDTSSVMINMPNQKYKVDTIVSILPIDNLKFTHSDGIVYTKNCANKAYIWVRKVSSQSENEIFSFDYTSKALNKLPIQPRGFPTTNKWYYTGPAFEDFCVCKDGFFYYSGQNLTNGIELVKTDGTILGTQILQELNPAEFDSDPEKFIIYKDEIYFNAQQQINGSYEPSIYKIVGNSIQKLPIKADTNLNVFYRPSIFKNKILDFKTNSLVENDVDGTNMNTIKTIENAYKYLPMGEKEGFFYFMVQTFSTVSIWKTDITSTGTSMVKEVNARSIPDEVVFYKNRFYFSLNVGNYAEELWVSDGSAAGTDIFIDLWTINGFGSTPKELNVIGDKLYFLAYIYTGPSVSPIQLWVTDGTVATTKKLTDIPDNLKNTIRYNSNKIYLEGQYGLVYVHDILRDKSYRIQKSIHSSNNFSYYLKNILKGDTESYLLFLDIENGDYYTKFYKECDSYKPYFHDMYLSYRTDNNIETYSIVGNPQSTFYWLNFLDYSNPIAIDVDSLNQRFFDNPIRVFAKESNGCMSPVSSPYQYWSPKVEVFHGVERCEPYKLLFSLSPTNGGIEVDKGFRALMFEKSNPETMIPLNLTVVNNTEFKVDLPTYLGLELNENYVISIRRNPDNYYSYSLNSIPRYVKSSMSIIKDTTVLLGDSAKILLLPKINLKGHKSFITMNNTPYETINPPLFIKLKANETNTFRLSEYSNSCGVGEIKRNSIIVKVKTPCNNFLNHTGQLSSLIYNSDSNILSEAQVNENKIIEYNAKNSITLKPGFNAALNSSFKATIKTCQ